MKARLWAAAGAVMLAGTLALPASAANAATATTSTSATVRSADQPGVSQVAPRSGTDCNPNPFASVSECTTVLGAGLKITQITGIPISNVDTAIAQVHIQIYGPNGTIQNCPAFTLPAYNTSLGCTWKNPSPNTSRPAGDYCSTAWEHVSGNNYAKLSTECIDVHS